MHSIISQISLCGLNPKSEIAKAVVIDIFLLIAIGIILVFKLPTVYIGYFSGGLLLFNLAYFNRYGNIYRQLQFELENEFIEVFTYFGIYISNGHNVYQSLIAIKPFCSDRLKGLIDTLISEIDEDKSVRPFVKFSSYFQNVSIKEVLLSIYQMVDEGGGDNYIRQYESLFGKFSDERHALNLAKRRDSLGTLTVLPLIGSGSIMVILSISLVQIMGSYISVV